MATKSLIINKNSAGILLIRGIRQYHSSNKPSVKNLRRELHPWLVTGLTDSEKNNKLVIWGTNLGSNVGYPKFTKIVSNMIELPFLIKSFIYGILLSDATLNFASKTNKNARLGIKQSLGHFAYLWYVFNKLSPYCSSYPHFIVGKRNNSINYALQFFTRSLPCFTIIYSSFYNQGIKNVPEDIFEYLTPMALAQFIMGDGSKQRHGLILCTDSYSIQDVVRLINVLIIKYDLICSIREHKEGQYRIYISQKSMHLLKSIVEPHMIPSMMYKINR